MVIIEEAHEFLSAHRINQMPVLFEQVQCVSFHTQEAAVIRENHHLWGQRYLLTLAYQKTKPTVTLDHKRITLTVRLGSDTEKRAAVIHEWHKSLRHTEVPGLIEKWEAKLGVKVNR